MQNRYVGDMGDFAKHGLLRFLSGVTDTETSADRLRLGLIWYMHHDEVHTATDKTKVNYDGKHTSYLAYTPENLRKFASCDHVLWDKLGHLVGQDARCVHCVEASRILPCDTLFYDAMLHFVPKLPRAQKENLREHWLTQALRATEGGGHSLRGPRQRHGPRQQEVHRRRSQVRLPQRPSGFVGARTVSGSVPAHRADGWYGGGTDQSEGEHTPRRHWAGCHHNSPSLPRREFSRVLRHLSTGA